MTAQPATPIKPAPGMRECSKCHRAFPATSEYFYRSGSALAPDCKSCRKEQVAANRKERQTNGPRQQVVKTAKRCPRCERELPATLEYFYALRTAKSGLQVRCKDCTRETDVERKRRRVQERRAALGDGLTGEAFATAPCVVLVHDPLHVLPEYLALTMRELREKIKDDEIPVGAVFETESGKKIRVDVMHGELMLIGVRG